MSSFLVSVEVIGTSVVQFSGFGSYGGCVKEAKAVKQSLLEKFTVMGPGEWQSRNFVVSIEKFKDGAEIPHLGLDHQILFALKGRP